MTQDDIPEDRIVGNLFFQKIQFAGREPGTVAKVKNYNKKTRYTKMMYIRIGYNAETLDHTSIDDGAVLVSENDFHKIFARLTYESLSRMCLNILDQVADGSNFDYATCCPDMNEYEDIPAEQIVDMLRFATLYYIPKGETS